MHLNMSSDQNNNTKPVITYISDSCSSTLNSLVVYIMSKNWSFFSNNDNFDDIWSNIHQKSINCIIFQLCTLQNVYIEIYINTYQCI